MSKLRKNRGPKEMKNRIALFFIYALIAAAPAQAATIAVLDTGVDTSFVPELNPFVIRPGFNGVTGTTDTFDAIGHGTLVSVYAVTASNFTATILPVKVSFGDLIPLQAAINGVNFATVQPRVRVINISYGGGPFDPASFQALANAVNNGKLVVLAAGNEGASGPVQGAKGARLLDGGAIAVGAIDNGGNIRPYSNRAGDNQNVYLVAPDDPQNLGVAGTSFSAPMVSGVAAAILNRYPYLNNRQVAEILLRSATDLGAPGTDPIYGRGRLNPNAAMSPIGLNGVPLTRSTAGPIALLNAEGIGVGGALGAALAEHSSLLGNVLILDEYERDFHVDLAGALLDDRDVSHLRQLFVPLDRRLTTVDVTPEPGMSLRIWREDLDPRISERFTGPAPGFDAPRTGLSLAAGLAADLDYRMDLNRPPRTALSAVEPEDTRFLTGISAAGFTSFGETADSGTLRYAMTEDLSLSFGTVRTHETDGYARDSEANLLAGAWDVGDRATVVFQLGNLQENGSLLGGSSSGAFSVAETETDSWLLGARWRLAADVNLFGYYGRAESRPEVTNLSLIEDISTLESETFGVGLSADNLVQWRDSFGLSVSRPLRVIDGTATLSVPQSRDLAGNTTVARETVSLSPSAAATDIETYYYFNVGTDTRIGTHLVYTHNPNHSEQLPDSVAVYATLSRSF